MIAASYGLGMNHPRRAVCLRVLCLLAAETASVLALHRLGRVPWLDVGWHELTWWLRTTPAEDALPAVLRSVALAVAWWLLASTVLCLLARLSGLAGAVRLADGLALPMVRRLAQRMAVAGLSAGLALGPVATAGAQPVVVPPDAKAVSTMFGQPGSRGNAMPQPPRDAGNDRTRPRPTRLDRYRVRDGDNLWAIAQRQVAAHGAADSTDAVAGYWLRLVDAATPGLHSEDPDLIHPGEVVILPPPRP
ncbi:MAG: LysM peptidoglycan-binding domain-containing protein [Acidimicrobiia bacterium]|nr:LysM peptidoglycan-binding domain-containing protein [Acidimicrobiia bacterium]